MTRSLRKLAGSGRGRPYDESVRTNDAPSRVPGARLDLAERTAAELRSMIIDGALAPGQQLHEAALAQSLGVSRNSLREAYRIGIHDGLLERHNHRGVFVRVPSLASLLDIYRVRRMIEEQAVRHAVPRHPALGAVREAVAAAQEHRRAGRWRQVGSMNMAFHAGLVALADSERLDQWFARLAAELRLAFRTIADAEYLHAPFVDANASIAALLAEGRMAEAADALDAYFTRSERTLVAAYARG